MQEVTRQVRGQIERRHLKALNRSRRLAYRAAGGSHEEIAALEAEIDRRNLSESEKIYFKNRIIPYARNACDLAIESRKAALSYVNRRIILSFVSGVISIASSSIVPTQYQVYSLNILSVITGVAVALDFWARATEPALDWLGNRRIFVTLIGNSFRRLGMSGVYAHLSDWQAYQKMVELCENAISASELELSSKLKSLITATVADEKADSGESAKEDGGDR